MWRLRRIRRRRARVRTEKERAYYYATYKEYARTLILDRIAYWKNHIDVNPGRVAVKDQRSRWGSCSTKGNLNFNYRIAFLPAHLMDYVIVHELTHLLEFNHSSNFWNKVEAVLPEYQAHKQELHAYSLMLVSHDALRVIASPLLTEVALTRNVSV